MDTTLNARADTERFKILDHIPLGVLVLDAVYRVVFWNKCLAYWTGLGVAGITGRDIREQYPQFAEKRFATRIESVFRGGPPIIFSSHIHKYLIPATLPDGSHRLQHVTVSPMRGPDDAFLAMFMIQDVTEVNTRLIQRKKAEDELRRVMAQLEESNARAVHMAKQAQEANAAKSIFLANMSHEIRTPMSGVLGALDMLASNEKDPEKLKLLRMTMDSAHSLLQIINDILDLSKVEAGKLELRPENVALEPIMERCRHLYSFPAQAKNLELRLEMGSDLPRMLRTDPTRLEQVLRNLLDNAVKFTNQGRISFGAERIDDPDLGPALCFRVRDTGIGIAATAIERLFQPFSQADSSYAKTSGGTGLGLALCHRMVELMGGTMAVQSTPGQGSEFSFLIPLQPVASDAADQIPMPASSSDMTQPAPHRPEMPNPASPGISEATDPGKSSSAPLAADILVAEDVDLNRQYLAFLLGQYGYRYDLVTSGIEAVRAFEGKNYDLILMDIQMPDMDGLEATTRIRTLEQERGTPRTPIIALTAYVLPEERETFLSKGMDGFSPKPIQGDQLHAEMQRLLTTGPAETRPSTLSPSSSESPRTRPISDPDPDPCLDSRPVFNLQDVKTRFLGNDNLWQTIALRFYQEELPEYLEHIHPLLHDPDLQETARLAHKIKGALGTLCADPARDAALVVEKAAKSGNVLETKNGLRLLLAELQRIPEAPETAKRA